MTAAIEAINLYKRYPGAKSYALENLNLEVQAGEIYGFLGANGAGKSTTIRTLLNFIHPTRGHAKVLGQDSVRDSVSIKHRVGYLAGEVALYPGMTGKQFFDYLSGLQPIKDPVYMQDLIRSFQAEVNKPLQQLSKGNRQKIGLIQALMHQPDILILDEPTSGLDPLMQEVFFDTIQAARQRGATVFVSSHNLSEVKRMCDRVGFIRRGSLVAELSMAELSKTAAQTFDVTFTGKVPLSELRRANGIDVQPTGPNRATIRARGELSPLLAILAKTHVVHLEKPPVNLEEEFLHFYNEDSGKGDSPS